MTLMSVKAIKVNFRRRRGFFIDVIVGDKHIYGNAFLLVLGTLLISFCLRIVSI
ncbi:hypothetical protein HMPREF9380_0582 [Streptococcus sanguinis SK49]|uniref:Uncharacterized protein n=1 Tax=Streptococcus sanguinis SK49 TaxID=888808 RepID=F3UVP4_STRSA|nr:hypothetical protein HMPREF9380_0582 [Streptococcus sanguinis SK49]